MTTTLTPFEEEKLRELEEKIAPLIVKDYNEFVENAGEIGEMDLEEILTERAKPFLLSSLHQQREMIRAELDKDLTLLLREFANTPLSERKTGWEWIIRTRLLVQSLLSNKEI